MKKFKNIAFVGDSGHFDTGSTSLAQRAGRHESRHRCDRAASSLHEIRQVCLQFLLRRSEVVFWIDEWSIEFGYHWLMLLMFLTAHLFQFRFVDSEQYCNMVLRLRCRRHKFLVVRH